MTKEEHAQLRERRMAEVWETIARWDGKNGEWFWISFVDDENGGFLGVSIVRAPTPAAAPFIAHMRGCNPGGQAASWPLPEEAERRFHPAYTYRLLTRAEAAEVDAKGKHAEGVFEE